MLPPVRAVVAPHAREVATCQDFNQRVREGDGVHTDAFGYAVGKLWPNTTCAELERAEWPYEQRLARGCGRPAPPAPPLRPPPEATVAMAAYPSSAAVRCVSKACFARVGAVIS